jgi:hypothetical protein
LNKIVVTYIRCCTPERKVLEEEKRSYKDVAKDTCEYYGFI